MSILLSLFLAVAAPVIERGEFTIYQSGKKIGTEEFSITAERGGYVAEGRTRISAPNQSFDLRSRMDLDAQLRLTFYEYESKGNVIRVKVQQPLSELQYTVNGKTEPDEVRLPPDSVIVDHNFFHHYLILLYRAGISGTTVPAFVPQDRTVGALSVRQTGERTFEVQTENLKIVATTDAQGRMIRLTAPEANVVVER
jgi:hypothetical protein